MATDPRSHARTWLVAKHVPGDEKRALDELDSLLAQSSLHVPAGGADRASDVDVAVIRARAGLARATPAPRPAKARAGARRAGYEVGALDAASLGVALVAGGFVGLFENMAAGAVAAAAVAIIVGWQAALWRAGCYHRLVLARRWQEMRRVVQASAAVGLVVCTVGFLWPGSIPRAPALVTVAIGAGALAAGRLLASLRRARALARGASRQRVLLVGDPGSALEAMKAFGRAGPAGYQIVGVCIPENLVTTQPQRLGDVAIVGSFRTIDVAVSATAADLVVITTGAQITSSFVRRLAWQLDSTGTGLGMMSGSDLVAQQRLGLEVIGDTPLVHLAHRTRGGWRLLVKSALDRVLGLIFLALSLPLMVLLAAAIKLDSKGPVLFRQTRVGRGGHEFSIVKFRSMVKDAHKIFESLAHLNETDGLLFKMKADPRVTLVGRFLRRWSLDELPSLLNVIRGEMSLVGPRPPLPPEAARFDEVVARRLLIKPGITGLWQVNGRSDLSWEDGIRYDLYYVDNWSIGGDFVILLRTIPAVIGGRGAY